MFVAPGAQKQTREPAPGEHIGHYQVLCRIGAGGMGEIYEVEHVTLRRRAALKILQHEVSERDAALERSVPARSASDRADQERRTSSRSTTSATSPMAGRTS